LNSPGILRFPDLQLEHGEVGNRTLWNQPDRGESRWAETRSDTEDDYLTNQKVKAGESIGYGRSGLPHMRSPLLPLLLAMLMDSAVRSAEGWFGLDSRETRQGDWQCMHGHDDG